MSQMVSSEPPAFLTAQEAATLLRGSARTLRNWTQQGRCPAKRTLGRRIVYDRVHLFAWVAAGGPAVAPGAGPCE
jgi:excisionase family DNA binding protein